MIVAVDGPAASGKGTIARAIARQLNLPHLDTGLLYRAVAMTVLRGGGDPANEALAVAACAIGAALLDDPELRSEAAAAAASIVSAHPGVRAALIERQRAFSRTPGGAVLDGRDIGTVIAPDADRKLFVTATPEIRAERRHRELASHGGGGSYEAILADILARDRRDATRRTAPLARAPDAILIDTSALDIDQAIAAAMTAVTHPRS